MSKKNKRDYYEVLGVRKDASKDEIKHAYRRLALTHHPDRVKENKAEAKEKFMEIQEAYSVLSDDERRRTYDQFGFNAPEMGGFGGEGFSGMSDIFDMFFGRGNSPFGSSRDSGSSRRRRQQYGEDIEQRVEIEFKEAVFGVKIDVQLRRYEPCGDCHGSGAAGGSNSTTTCDRCHGRGEVQEVRSSLFGRVVQVTSCPQCRGEGKIIKNKCPTCRGEKVIRSTKKINVTIPPGVESGMSMKVQGMGHIPTSDAIPGDLYITIRVKQDPQFERDNLDIRSTQSISIVQAMKGAQIRVETIDGFGKIRIPPGTQSGTEFRVRGKGFTRLNRLESRGDHIVTVQVIIPDYKKLDKETQSLINQLDDNLPKKYKEFPSK
ncbi:MAG: molecular chaperone DnaJ [Promethearchaeota archaeon]|nr:MAG: molecular chaperone DnaJ [Candidatus Lokiarchaeota archaeon]